MAAAEFDLIPIPIQRQVPRDSWRPPADIRMISADDHNLEVDHLYEDRLPAKFKDRAPRFWRDKDTGLLHMRYKDRSYDPPGIGTIGQECPGFWDREERLRVMAVEGIEGSVLYHGQLQSLNAIMTEDPELYTACMDAYNEWLIEYTGPAANKLVGVAMLPSFLKPETARDQMQKLKQLGYKAVQMPSYPRGVRYNSRDLDPLWSAIVEAGIPLSFHVTAFQEFHGYGSLGANLSRNLSPFRPLLGQLIFSGCSSAILTCGWFLPRAGRLGLPMRCTRWTRSSGPITRFCGRSSSTCRVSTGIGSVMPPSWTIRSRCSSSTVSARTT